MHFSVLASLARPRKCELVVDDFAFMAIDHSGQRNDLACGTRRYPTVVFRIQVIIRQSSFFETSI